MKKVFVLLAFMFTLLLTACGINTNKNVSSNNVNATEGKAIVENNNKISIYIDKNCEAAGVKQCDFNEISKGMKSVFKDIDFEKVYITEKNKSIVESNPLTTPFALLSKNIISKLDKQIVQGMEQYAVKNNGNYYLPLYGWNYGEENLCSDGKDNNGDGLTDEKDPTCSKVVVLSSNNCKEQYCSTNFFNQLIGNVFLGYYDGGVVDYNTTGGKDLYNKAKALGINSLPIILVDKVKPSLKIIAQFIKEGENKYFISLPDFKYNPDIEACNTDCNASPSCKKLLSCNKTDKPKVELFVMSYCPYGTQAEKGMLPIIKLLKDKIDFKLRFVNYIMHSDKGETEENTLQHCIQKEQPEKLTDYLTCFLDKGDTKGCKEKVGIDENKISSCINESNTQFNIEKNKNDKASYVGGQFPKYEVDDKLNIKYGVQGSPTLVINGITVQPSSRSPQAYLNTICEAFKEQPEECKKVVSDKSYDPSFGWTQSGKPVPAGSCGAK